MEQKILSLFTRNHELKFSEIEKSLNVRSNKLNYHLQNLVKKGVISKTNNKYALTEASEYLIPYLSPKKAPLPVVLIHIGDKKSSFLCIRQKRPYRGLLSLPGGRILISESLHDSVKRIMKEKYDIEANLTKIHSISLEHIKKQAKIIYSFVLFFVSAKSPSPLILTNINKNKSKIIKSDMSLLKNDLNKEIKISTINSNIKE